MYALQLAVSPQPKMTCLASSDPHTRDRFLLQFSLFGLSIFKALISNRPRLSLLSQHWIYSPLPQTYFTLEEKGNKDTVDTLRAC